MAYDVATKERARDHFEIHAQTLKEIGKIMGIPVTTLSDWKREGNWIAGKLKGKIGEVRQKMMDNIHKDPIYQTIKKEVTEELGKLTVSPADAVIIDSRAEKIMLEAIGIERFNAFAMEGVLNANMIMKNLKAIDKLQLRDIESYMRTMGMGKDIIFGKNPEIMIMNNNGDMKVEDLGALSTEQLYAMMNAKKADNADKIEVF